MCPNALTSYDMLPQEMRRYINAGKELKESKEIVQIKKELEDLKIKRLSSIYLAIIGPSYIGKTQTAFTLLNSINLLYVNLVESKNFSGSGAIQRIYSSFHKIALIFRKCISKDMDIIRLELNDPEFKSLSIFRSKAPLHSLGLIFTLYMVYFK